MGHVIKIEELWKEYRLGVIGYGTLTQDVQSWVAKLRGKEDPNQKISTMLAGQKQQVDGNRFWALRDVNLDIEQGDVLGIIGKNGAGKSTLLKILSRVTAPTSGSVKVKGRIASLLEVGTGFHPELTGRENIFLNGAILGMSKAEVKRKLDEIIDFSGVEQHIDTPVKRYSSGMYVRLAFAVVAHLEPEILLVDEVLAVGDADFQKKCLGRMKSVSKSGRTIVFVSHNMSAVENICNKSLLFQNGELKMRDKTPLVINEYLAGSKSSLGAVALPEKDQDAYINEVSVVDDSGGPSATLRADDTFKICCKFTVTKELRGVEIYFRISDPYENLIFHSSSNPKNGSGLPNFSAGVYHGIVNVPKHFLAPGRYNIMANIQQQNIRLIDYNKDVLSFDILTTGVPKQLAGHVQGGIGKVLFCNEWDIKKV